MALSWNEIKDRALKFSNEWVDETRERAEKDSFWNDFFNVFGISRRRVAGFEEPVKKLGNKQGFIDLFWKGTLLVEHKSKGKDLNKAFEQAIDYFPGLKEHELPKYILVSDFENIKLYDLDERTEHEFHIKEFYKNVKLFGFIAGYQKRTFKEEDPVNIQAAELMGKLHDQLKDYGYEGHPLEVYLVRLLFILFADDTGIFEKDIFKEFIDRKTNEDGSNLGALMAQFFQILNTPLEKRMKNIDEHLSSFPYINGKLFEEFLPIAAFNSSMRNILLEACGLDWGKISPAIFGSLFQSVMNPEERRNLGAHYTSEKNIFKLIKPLFLDELRAEFEKVKSSKPKLKEFHKKLSTLKFLDPACGSGNFLIITYRELRQLEIDILRELYKYGERFLNISDIIWVDIDQFYGIEYDEFAARIAEVAMWLIDHQMNMKISEEFGQYFVRLPLTKSAKIIHGNALRIDWNTIVEGSSIDVTASQTNIIQVNEPISHYETLNVYTKTINITKGNLPVEDKKWDTRNRGKVDYILGNPPFLGKSNQNKEQKEDVQIVFKNVKNASDLDYVSCWYYKAMEFNQNTNIKIGFVSTNSITQGEQVGILWKVLLNRFSVNIHFAHRTFQWNNEARGKAAVHCIILGFASFDTKEKFIYDYDDIKGEPHQIKVRMINQYLIDGPMIWVEKRSNPLCDVPLMKYGNKPTDNGNFLFTGEEREAFLKEEPDATPFFRKYIGSREFINNISRWCLWLKDINPAELKKLPKIIERIEKVREFRMKSSAKPTVLSAQTPSLFFYISHSDRNYLVIPETSSVRRKYIPFGYMGKKTIASNALYTIPDADLYIFGQLCSSMHMTWVKNIGGKLKSDYRYSASILYNT